MKKFLILLFTAFFLIPATSSITLAGLAVQDEDNDRAREVFEEFDKRRAAVTYETSLLEMRIIDRRDRVRSRSMRQFTHTGDNFSRSLTVFEAPADVRGTGLLNLDENGSEVQMLYLPATGRVQTVSGSQRSDRFMGSDFTFEDLGAQNPDDFEFELLEEENNRLTVKAIPKGESQYSSIHFTLDTERYVLIKALYFESGDKAVKELTAHGYEEVRDGIWRPSTMIMKDLAAERRTELEWKERTLDEPIPDRFFTERQLRRGVQ
ncbi:MAG: outer membrane lipoprotein-sorting protein [Balneolales bacterium]|nr:outer membrane lipoprotein-sorting protein [Balneolales bacterium]